MKNYSGFKLVESNTPGLCTGCFFTDKFGRPPCGDCIDKRYNCHDKSQGFIRYRIYKKISEFSINKQIKII